MEIINWVEDASLESAGLYTAVKPIAEAGLERGNDVSVNSFKHIEDVSHWGNIHVRNLNVKNYCTKKTGVVNHTHGLWAPHSMISSLSSRFSRTPLVISPHGMLDSWAMNQSSIKKKLAIKLYERSAFKRASYVHALTSKEADDIRRFFGGSIRIEVIPNGVDIPKYTNEKSLNEDVNIVFISRINKKKGLVELINAWSCFTKSNKFSSRIKLIIAGWGDEALVQLIKRSKLVGLRYVGPVFGEEKEKLMQSAHFTILPSFSEGLPMAVLESWAHGVPAAISKECNLLIGYERGAALRAEPSEQSLVDCFCSISEMSNSDYSSMKNNSLSLVKDMFSWSKITENHYDLYGYI